MNPEQMREHFERVSQERFAEPLADRFEARLVDAPTWEDLAQPLWKEIFPREDFVAFEKLFTDAERERAKDLTAVLASPPLTHRMLLFEGGELVGCYWGYQELYNRYYMCVTGIRERARGRGLYTALLARLLPLLGELGFREVISRHHMDNNAVIVPKLKAGFSISGFEVTARYGVLITMRHVFNEKLRRVGSFRIDAAAHGKELLDDELIRYR